MQFAAAVGQSKLLFQQCYVIVGFKVAPYAQFVSSGQTIISEIRQKKKILCKSAKCCSFATIQQRALMVVLKQGQLVQK